MKFRNHRLVDAPFNAARYTGGKITPTVVILHDTASPLDTGNSARYLQHNSAGVSVHFVVERDGSVEQQVATNRRANHAGRSHYHGQKGVNNFSIGIEIVNPGRMTKGPRVHTAVTWFKRVFDMEEHGIQHVETREHGAGFWMDYTPEQIEAVTMLLVALFDYVPTLKDVQTHWYVSPGRKVDTNPLFPLAAIRAKVLGREDVLADELDDVAESAAEDGSEMVSIDVPNSSLNMRRWPSFNPNVIAAIPDGVIVPVIKRGTFGGRAWLKVGFDGKSGWVVARYTAPVVHKN